MRLVLQRVSSARVRVEGRVVAQIGRGMVVLAGVERGDGEGEVERAVDKLAGLRLFADAGGRMNLDAGSAGGEFLVVSQFTLAASLTRGRRPSFERAADPETARPLVAALAAGLRRRGFPVGEGVFGALMEVELVNDGPVTLVLDLPPR